jgi:signal transduction histidine kinase
MALAAMIALIGAWLFASLHILRPIDLAVLASQRLAAGDLSARTGASATAHRGEIGQLLLALDEMAAALERSQERMRQMEKMDAIGRLAGGISHDFNNLLTAIIGFGELLKTRLAGVEPEQTYVSEMVRAGERAGDLTRQLLIFSRKTLARTELVDLNLVVQEMGNLLRRLIGEDVAQVTVLTPDIGPVRADPAQIEQIILNLATNARDAMPNGGKLTIETARVTLDPAFVSGHPGARPGPQIMLAVTDTGMGMDRETQARIFEPFFTTKPAGQGTGLGLATVFAIVQAAEGSVWVYSEPGQGTSFKIYLPQADDVEAAGGPEEASADIPTGIGTVLLVEDEPAVRTLAQTVLEFLGYVVLVASGAEEALRHGAEHPDGIDLLLTDLVLPGRSGQEIAEELSRICSGIRVLYMSGYTDDSVVRHGLLQGEMDYLEKPFTPAALARKVAEVLEAGRQIG